MSLRPARLIVGLLILAACLTIFVLARHLLETGAVENENKITALFLLFNPLLILISATFGIFLNILFLISIVLITQGLSNTHHVDYLFFLSLISVLTSAISVSIVRNLYSRLRSCKEAVKAAQDRLDGLNMDLEENARIKTALTRKFDRFSKLKFVSEELSTTLTLEEVTRFAVNRITEIITKADTALVYLVDEKHLGYDEPQLLLSSVKAKDTALSCAQLNVDIFDRWILRHAGLLIITDVKKDFRFSPEAVEDMRRDVRALIAAPLISESKILGVLRLDSLVPEVFGPDDLRILDIFADLLAVALDNALLYNRMEELAKRDGLTNLFLPRYFHAQLEAIMDVRFLAETKTISLLMLDIDYFKGYNDRHGHIAGDIVLKKIAHTLNLFLKGSDFAVRYGGEEFLLILVGADRNAAVERAESIRKEVAGQVIFLRRQETRVTVSIGIATYPDDGKTKEELLLKADAWLYYAKEKGRNRVAYTGIK